jgi:chromosome segregation ATPase
MATQDEVFAACERLVARGARPTVDRVREELGGGSLNALTPMVRAWREAQQAPGANLPPAGPAEPITLPTAVQRAVDALSAAVTGLVPAFGVAIAEVAETERRRSRLEVDAAATRAAAEVEEARQIAADERALTDAVRAEATGLETALAAKDLEIERLAALGAEQTAEVERLTALLERERTDRTEAEARVAELTDRLQAARSDTAAAQAAARSAEGEAQRQRDLAAVLSGKLETAQTTIAGLQTELAVVRQAAEGERQRAERAEAERSKAELAARDAVGRAALAEGELAALRAEDKTSLKPRRGAGAH